MLFSKKERGGRRCFGTRFSSNKGFTLVELLVVIAIIGVLVALLLPAVQAAREAARRNSCKNQLKQIALGCINHESSTQHLPSGGWNSAWVGDADRGSGPDQPGSWIYNILPFIEQQAIHDLPSDGQPEVVTTQQRVAAEQMIFTEFDTLNCPSRTNPLSPLVLTNLYRNATPQPAGTLVPTTDYVANYGDSYRVTNVNNTLGNYAQVPTFDWANGPTGEGAARGKPAEYWTNSDPEPNLINGVIFSRSKIAFRNISDGTSRTYLAGEKWQETAGTVDAGGSNHPWSSGATDDTLRTASHPPLQNFPVTQDQTAQFISDNAKLDYRFGGPHASGMHMAFCDGHVETVSYDVDIFVHQTQANRQDGQVIQE